MKRVLPLWGVNYSNIKEVLKAWLQQKYPHHGEEFCSLFEQKECISLETIDDFSPIAFEDGGDLKTLSEMVEVNKSNSVFEAFLRYGVYMEILPPRFLLEEVIDILYVLPS